MTSGSVSTYWTERRTEDLCVLVGRGGRVGGVTDGHPSSSVLFFLRPSRATPEFILESIYCCVSIYVCEMDEDRSEEGRGGGGWERWDGWKKYTISYLVRVHSNVHIPSVLSSHRIYMDIILHIHVVSTLHSPNRWPCGRQTTTAGWTRPPGGFGVRYLASHIPPIFLTPR